MNATELMIGDWFQTTYPNGKVEFRKVEGVMQNHIVCNNGVTNAFEPIPLTAEILEKNGFEETDKCCSFKDNYCSISIYLDRIEGEEIDNASIFLEGALFDMHININYVHEFQHALKLCGIDKEIVL